MTSRDKGGPPRGLESLAELRKRLPSAPPAPARPARTSPRVEPPPAAASTPEADDDPQADPVPPEEAFEAAMGALHVAGLPDGPLRVRPTPPEARRTGAGPKTIASKRRDAGVPSEADRDLDADPELRELLGRVRSVRAPRPVSSPSQPLLDLHGFSAADAVHELRRFLALHRAERPVTVRVIAGKGRFGAVVRPAAEEALDASADVIEWSHGAPSEGGEGLLLVRLRRLPRAGGPGGGPGR